MLGFTATRLSEMVGTGGHGGLKGTAADPGVWDREERCGYRGRRSRRGAAVARSRGRGEEGDAGSWARTVSGTTRARAGRSADVRGPVGRRVRAG